MTERLSITLRAVSVRRSDKWVLRDISLSFKAGERWALIGGNGAGKTQLLKVIGTDIWPAPGPATLLYRLGRRRVDVIEAKRRIAYIGAELQDKYARYNWNLDVQTVLATGLHRSDLLLQPVTRSERRQVAAALELCGLAELAKRRFLALSYGQKRLTLLARALIQDPDWLLLDEFYNGLDLFYRQRIDGILEHARSRGQSWVISAHRAMDVPHGTRGLIDIRAGKIHSVTRLRSADLLRLADRAEESAGQAKKAMRPPSPKRAARSRTRVDAPVLVRIEKADLYVDYRPVLQAIDWELRAGEHWAVFGANGAGKSSFLKLLYGDLSPALGGRIERTGFPRGTPIDAWKRQVGLVSPELQTDYAVNVTVHDLVASGRYASIGLCDPPTAADKRNARRWLEFFALRSMAARHPRELSYGQLRRALFARALAGNARILLLDEPLTGLDPRQRAVMKRLLERLMKRRISLVIAVHHPEDLPGGMTHGLRLHNLRAEPMDLQSSTWVCGNAAAGGDTTAWYSRGVSMLRVAAAAVLGLMALCGCSHSGYAVRPVPRIAADNVGKPVKRLKDAFGAPRKVDATPTKLVYVWFLEESPAGAPVGFHGCEMEVTVDIRSEHVLGYSLSNVGWGRCREVQRKIRIAEG